METPEIENVNDVEKNDDAEQKTTDSDLFSYTKTDYTTEIFKIEIRGLPKRCEYKVKKMSEIFILFEYFLFFRIC